MYNVVVSGSRTAAQHPENVQFIRNKLDALKKPINVLYHGDAEGVDAVAEQWARDNNVHYKSYPAYWDVYDFDQKKFVKDKGAGPKRNNAMIEGAKTNAWRAKNRPTEGSDPVDVEVILVAFHDKASLDLSKGTHNAVKTAQTKKIAHWVFELPVKENAATEDSPFPEVANAS